MSQRVKSSKAAAGEKRTNWGSRSEATSGRGRVGAKCLAVDAGTRGVCVTRRATFANWMKIFGFSAATSKATNCVDAFACKLTCFDATRRRHSPAPHAAHNYNLAQSVNWAAIFDLSPFRSWLTHEKLPRDSFVMWQRKIKSQKGTCNIKLRPRQQLKWKLQTSFTPFCITFGLCCKLFSCVAHIRNKTNSSLKLPRKFISLGLGLGLTLNKLLPICCNNNNNNNKKELANTYILTRLTDRSSSSSSS